MIGQAAAVRHYHRYELPAGRAGRVRAAATCRWIRTPSGLLLGDGCITGHDDADLRDGRSRSWPRRSSRAAGVDGIEVDDGCLRLRAPPRATAAGAASIVANPVTAVLRDARAGRHALGDEVRPATLPAQQRRGAARACCRACSTPTAGRSPRAAAPAGCSTRPARERLRDDVVFLVRSLGGVAYVADDGRREGRKPGLSPNGRPVRHRHDAYVLDIRLPDGRRSRSGSARKRARVRRDRRRSADAVHRRASSRPGEAETVCIQVGGRRLAVRHRRLPRHPQHPQRRVHHPRRGAEHHARADEDVPDPARLRLQDRGHRRRHPDRPARRHASPACGSSRRSSTTSRTSPSTG